MTSPAIRFSLSTITTSDPDAFSDSPNVNPILPAPITTIFRPGPNLSKRHVLRIHDQSRPLGSWNHAHVDPRPGRYHGHIELMQNSAHELRIDLRIETHLDSQFSRP